MPSTAALVACGGAGSPDPERDMAGRGEFRKAVAGHRTAEVFVAAADGARLASYACLPAEGDGPFPTLAMFTA